MDAFERLAATAADLKRQVEKPTVVVRAVAARCSRTDFHTFRIVLDSVSKAAGELAALYPQHAAALREAGQLDRQAKDRLVGVTLPPIYKRCFDDGFRASWRNMRIGLEQQGHVAPALTLYGLRHTVAVIPPRGRRG